MFSLEIDNYWVDFYGWIDNFNLIDLIDFFIEKLTNYFIVNLKPK
jgi:hypothetical protein